jgi:hypothetical protein
VRPIATVSLNIDLHIQKRQWCCSTYQAPYLRISDLCQDHGNPRFRAQHQPTRINKNEIAAQVDSAQVFENVVWYTVGPLHCQGPPSPSMEISD